MKRRNLSGIYLFERFDGESKRKPTCFEECMPKTQEEFLDTLDEAGLKRMCLKLAETIVIISNAFDITTEDEPEDGLVDPVF